MKIEEFKIQKSSTSSIISRNKNVHILYSVEPNSYQTKLMAAVLHTLGFPTLYSYKSIFEGQEFRIKYTMNRDGGQGDELIVCRTGEFISIGKSGDEKRYLLPAGNLQVRRSMFGVYNKNLSDSFLGVIYLGGNGDPSMSGHDSVVGRRFFNECLFLLGLDKQNDDATELRGSQLAEIEEEIERYNLFKAVGEYQNTIAYDHDLNKYIDSNVDNEKFEQELVRSKQELRDVRNEINAMDAVIQGNKAFVAYITNKNIYIDISKCKRREYGEGLDIFTEDGQRKPMRIVGTDLFDYDRSTFAESVIRRELEERESYLKSCINEIERDRCSNPSGFKELICGVSKLSPISLSEIDKNLPMLYKEKKMIESELRKEISEEIRMKLDEKVSEYCDEFDQSCHSRLPKKVCAFARKFAYIELLSDSLNYPVPIFFDLSCARKTRKDVTQRTLEILAEKFSGHQVFMSVATDYRGQCERIFTESETIDADEVFM